LNYFAFNLFLFGGKFQQLLRVEDFIMTQNFNIDINPETTIGDAYLRTPLNELMKTNFL